MSILILFQLCSYDSIILFLVLKMAIKISFEINKSLDLRIDWHRVLLLGQIKSILRAKKSFSICIEVA